MQKNMQSIQSKKYTTASSRIVVALVAVLPMMSLIGGAHADPDAKPVLTDGKATGKAKAEAKTPKRVLMVVTSHGTLGETGKPTGMWLEEFVAPYNEFKRAGYEIDVASIKGGQVPVDPGSTGNPKSVWVKRFSADPTMQGKIKNSVPVSAVQENDYDGVMLVGGHGTVWDFPGSQPLKAIVDKAVDANKVVGAVCHGVCGLTGKAVAGKRVTGFSDAEEQMIGLTDVVPLSTEKQLKGQRGRYSAGPAFRAHAVSDRGLITGQNPMSSRQTARRMIRAMKK